MVRVRDKADGAHCILIDEQNMQHDGMREYNWFEFGENNEKSSSTLRPTME